MAAKVDRKVLDRILYLRNQNLTQAVIGERLGLTARTVRLYLAMVRDGVDPFKKQEKDVQPESL